MTARAPRVLVIGSGGAGYCAAIAAREAGAEVRLLSKSPLGMASCTAYAGGGFTAPVGGFTPAEHMALTTEVGRGLSEPNMHRAVSEGAAAAFARLAGWGVRYDTRRGGISVANYGKGGLLGGTGMTLPLRDHAAAAGVEAVSGLVVTAILRADGGRGRAVGVETYNPANGEIEREPADAVIVATGGGGAIFPRSDNPARTTGDGYRLLFAAGVGAFDMEFVQWYPLGYAEPGFPTWMLGLPIVDHVPLETTGGDRFYDRLLAEWGLKGGAQANIRARDRSAVAIARQWAAGHEVVLRFDLVDPAVIERVDPLAAGRFRAGGGPRPVRVAPLVHYFCGGAVASPDGVTSVPGLFACGEVVGGFDGANRAGGNALTAVTVLSQLTGMRAATEAAAAARSAADPAGDAQAAQACGSYAGLAKGWAANADHLAQDAGAAAPAAAALREQMQEAVGKGLGVIRDATGLRACLASLEGMGSELALLAPATASERMIAAELPSMLLTARLVATGALLREESRGGHFRTEFPAEVSGWARHIVIEPAAVGAEHPVPEIGATRQAEVGTVTPAVR